ncbi:hypothetical protein GTH32_08140 [Alteromonas sp. 345S023]|jgi:hypothetical protein|uniref:PEP-CTERM sorting domain-containing protein n=1 Tax=Alteromonas profundi TaxID=2696062 RepID=A0A7X5RKZ0_9ALTE|nr:hypothetical protein [Alteromonas profundi]NDV91154.1 hypothetical protein [Alteromonas profundi]
MKTKLLSLLSLLVVSHSALAGSAPVATPVDEPSTLVVIGAVAVVIGLVKWKNRK